MQKIKLLELFGGISAPHKALLNLGFDVETVDYVEFDPKVVEVRNAIYGTDFKPKNVCEIKGDDYLSNQNKCESIDILFHGSPCQDFSVAGNRLGGEINSGTRSSLLWETIRIIREMRMHRPRVVIWENVKAVLHKNNIGVFEKYIAEMQNLGYTTTHRILNSKDFGIPQNRNRIFVVSVLRERSHKISFSFDDLNFKEMKPLKYFLEENPDKYYDCVQPSMLKAISKGQTRIIKDTAYTITTKQWRWNNAGVIHKLVPSGECVPPVYRILTEKECFLLMGFTDDDFDKIKHFTKHLIWKVSGNSIVVQVLEAIFKEIRGINEQLWDH